MNPDLPAVTVRLSRADAIVLLDWLTSTDLNTVPVTHPAQKQALTDLLSQFEVQTDVMGSTATQITQAQAEVAEDMGW